MNLDKLAAAIAGIITLAASIGQFPRLVFTIHKAQANLIQESKASRWGRLPLLR